MADLVSPCPGPGFQERFHGPEARTEVGSAGSSVGTAVPVWLEALLPPWSLTDLITVDAVSKTPRCCIWYRFLGKWPESSSFKISNFKHLLNNYLFNVCFLNHSLLNLSTFVLKKQLGIRTINGKPVSLTINRR